MNLSDIQKFTLTVNTTILALVLGLMGFFHVINVPFLVYFSIPTAMVYIIGYYLIHKGKMAFYARLVYFWLTFYMGVTTICLGYSYGFHLYCFSVVPTVFVAEYMGYKLRHRNFKAVPISFFVAIFYILCTGYVALNGPVFERDQKFAAFFWGANAIMVFGFLIGYLAYLVKLIINSEEQLVKAAHVDRLTGLYNRHYMLGYLESAADRKGGFAAMSDIDNFKRINDTYGHNGGDEVLRTVAETIKNVCGGCTVARWGGEEFLIVSEEDISEGQEMLERLRRTIESNPVSFEGQEIKVTITIGAASRRTEQTIDQWVQEADNRLYYGKNNGKNRVIVNE